MIGEFITAAGLIFISIVHPITEESVNCLALNMYHEARNQGTAGQLAVTAVVYNRVQDERFPNTICGVIKQGPTRESWKTKLTADPNDAVYYPIKNRCQFSWYCDGKNDIPRNKKKYEDILKLIYLILDDKILFIDITDGALFYHADYITPSWAKTKTKTIEIQDHIFYRWDTK